jgi:hypothetical protein
MEYSLGIDRQVPLLQQARELQASPLFDDARQRRQVVEHRIARLVQLGIRQARYFGRTRTLFQVCLAAMVRLIELDRRLNRHHFFRNVPDYGHEERSRR